MGQYIAARYVPRFMGTYDVTQTYEALDVVDNGLGTSYISKIPTPAGTPLTDTTHWAIYGATSGAIINLQNQIGDLTDLDTTDKDNLVDAINENVSEIQTLEGSFETNSRYTLASLKNKNAICIGDSWGVTQPSGTNNWIDLITPYFKNVYGNAHGGYSFNKSGASYITLFDALTIPSGTQIDCIIAIGGANGVNSGETTAFINHVRAVYPNADIIIGANGPMYSKSTFWAREQLIIKEAAKANCIVLDELWLTTAKTPEDKWTADNYHLKDYTTFVENIIGFLCSGVYPHTFDYGAIASPNFVTSDLTDYLRDVTFFTISRVKNNVAIQLSITKGSNYITAPSTVTLVNNQIYDIFEFPKAMLIPFYDNNDTGATSHMYVLKTGDYIQLVLRIPNDSPYARLCVRAIQDGTFSKSDVFNDAIILYTSFATTLFDFSSIHEIIRTNQLAFTTDQNVR